MDRSDPIGGGKLHEPGCLTDEIKAGNNPPQTDSLAVTPTFPSRSGFCTSDNSFLDALYIRKERTKPKTGGVHPNESEGAQFPKVGNFILIQGVSLRRRRSTMFNPVGFRRHGGMDQSHIPPARRERGGIRIKVID